MSASSQRMVRSAALLGLVAVLGTGMLATVHILTRDRIAERERQAILDQISQVMPDSFYNNQPDLDTVELHDESAFAHDAPVNVYRARNNGQPSGAIFNVVAPDGYNGDIRLLIGIHIDGSISGVRVISHRETPGLGDPIELRRSPWVLGFDGKSISNPHVDDWAVRRDGGTFDQFTGATITPRAVVETVQRTLEYFQLHRDELFLMEPTK